MVPSELVPFLPVPLTMAISALAIEVQICRILRAGRFECGS